MKKSLFLSAIAVVALASCSNEQVVDQPKGDNLIGFSPLTTRAAVVNDAEGLKTVPFKAWAYGTDTEAYINGTQVSYVTNEWTYTPKKAWASDPLDFYAFSPATTPDGVTLLNVKKKAQAFQYVIPAAVNKHADIMYAVKKNQTKTSANGKVGLMFKHALAQLVFTAQTTDAQYTAEINGIEVCNTKNKAVFRFPSGDTATGDASKGSWTLDDQTNSYGNFAIALQGATAVNVTSAAPAPVSATADVMMQIPQNATKWTTTKTTAVAITTANDNHECYLKIQLKLKDGGNYIVGSAAEFATVYLPFGGTAWEMGKKYIYNLKVGGNGAGFDDKGNPILKFIEFNPSVEPWVDVQVVDLDM